MSENAIVKIITDLGYIFESTTPEAGFHKSKLEELQGYKDLRFKNNFVNEISNPNLKTRLYFECKSKDCITIDNIATIGFHNEDLINVESPEEATKVFGWLKNVNEYLKKSGYDGVFNSKEFNNNVHNYTYKFTTTYMEEFQKMLSQFKQIYMGHNGYHTALKKTNGNVE